jgi:hypothetical protein
MNKFLVIMATLLLTASAFAGRSRPIYMPVDDLLFEVPNFTNAPKLDLDAALDRTNDPVFGDPGEEPIRRTREEKMDELINVLYIGEPEDKLWYFLPYRGGFFFYED